MLEQQACPQCILIASMRRSNSPIDLEDKELARQIVRRDPSFHDTPHHPYEGAEAPAGIGLYAGASALQLSHHSCDGEATVELMTVRLNARLRTYRLILCLWSRRACSSVE